MTESELSRHPISPRTSVVLLIFTILIGFVVIGPIIGFLAALPFIHGSFLGFAEKLADPANNPDIKLPLLVMQSFVTFVGLAVVPALYWWSIERRKPLTLLKSNGFPPVILIVIFLLVVSLVGPNSFFIDWNANFKFPEGMHRFEEWARKNEQLDEQLVKLFTTFESPYEFVFVFFTISILAGFSEELVFRGMLQPQLQKATGNPHVAIWVTAILFSALHLQFFGFVPRMILGALFGYLYYWSGNLWLPMIAHMINNGLSVLAIYLYQKGSITVDLDSTEPLPWPVIAVGTIFSFSLLMYFRNYYRLQKAAS